MGNPQRILVIPDLHGEDAALARLLHKSSVCDASGGLADGSVRVVQMGDVLGRGPAGVKAFRRLVGLAKAGSDMRMLCGDHEQMLLHALATKDTDDFYWWFNFGGNDVVAELGYPKYHTDNRAEVSEMFPGFVADLNADAGMRRTIATFGDEVRSAALSGLLQAADVVAGRLAVHGGLLPKFSPLLPAGAGVAEIAGFLNAEFAAMVRDGDFSRPLFKRGSRQTGREGSPGVTWCSYKELLMVEDELPCDQIVGHIPFDVSVAQPVPTIRRSPRGRVINVDVGVSGNEVCSYFEVVNGREHVVDDIGGLGKHQKVKESMFVPGRSPRLMGR